MMTQALALERVWRSLPSPVAAGLTLLLGWLLAHLLRFLVTHTLQRLRFEGFAVRVGIAEFLRKGGATYSPVQLTGMLTYWGTLAVTFWQISAILELGVARALKEHVRALAPSVLSALFILIIGVVVITFLANFIRTLALNAGVPSASFLARTIKSMGIGMVALIALDQAGFGRTILGPMVLITFGAVAFGAALAFGLGCKELARQAMERFIRNLRERERGPRGGDLEG